MKNQVNIEMKTDTVEEENFAVLIYTYIRFRCYYICMRLTTLK